MYALIYMRFLKKKAKTLTSRKKRACVPKMWNTPDYQKKHKKQPREPMFNTWSNAYPYCYKSISRDSVAPARPPEASSTQLPPLVISLKDNYLRLKQTPIPHVCRVKHPSVVVFQSRIGRETLPLFLDWIVRHIEECGTSWNNPWQRITKSVSAALSVVAENSYFFFL